MLKFFSRFILRSVLAIIANRPARTPAISKALVDEIESIPTVSIHLPANRSFRPVCVRCLIPCRDLGETSLWSIVTVDDLPVTFYFCPRCGLSKSLTMTENVERLERCKKWVGAKLKATVN